MRLSLLDNGQLFVTGTGTDLDSIQSAQIKIARTSSAKHKTDLPLIVHAIKQAKASYILGSRMALPLSAFPDGGFVEVSVVSSDQLDEIASSIRGGRRMTADTTSINQMRFL